MLQSSVEQSVNKTEMERSYSATLQSSRPDISRQADIRHVVKIVVEDAYQRSQETCEYLWVGGILFDSVFTL